MAKAKKKKTKRKAAGITGNDFATGVAGITLGNFIAHLMADGVGTLTGQLRGAGGAGANSKSLPAPPEDVAGKLLRALAEHGPKSIAELMALTGVGLSPLLQSLQTVREFRLVELVGEGEVVQLTPCGNHTVTVIRKDEIRDQAAKLLEG